MPRATTHVDNLSTGTLTIDDLAVSSGNEKWEDLRFPASQVRKGATQPPDENTDGTLLFSNARTEDVFCVAQLPHRWLEGSTIVPHVHWSKSSSASGDVVWKMDYSWFNIDAAYEGSLATTLELADVDVDDADTAYHHAVHSAEIAGTGKTISSIILINLYRDHDDDDDDYAADAVFFEFDIHYQVDSLGSDAETTK